jgi:hypothetical protein
VEERGDTRGTTRRVEEARHEQAPRPVKQGQQATEVVVPRDSSRWGPIWAGLITALTTFLLLELLAFGTGILTPNFVAGPDATASAWVSAIIGLVAFFTGGSVAGMTSAMRGPAAEALNGFLVWALGSVLILVLSALGLGQLFGALGSLVGQFGLVGQALGQGGAVNVPEGGLNLPQGINPQQYLDTVKSTAFWGFVSLAVAAAVSALGGYLGGRTSEPIGKAPDVGGHRG